MVGHLLGAAGAIEAIATIQVNVALLEAMCGFVSMHVALSFFFFVKLTCEIFNFSSLMTQAIRTGWVHPTINLENPESEVVRISPLRLQTYVKSVTICWQVEVVNFVQVICRGLFIQCFR